MEFSKIVLTLFRQNARTNVILLILYRRLHRAMRIICAAKSWAQALTQSPRTRHEIRGISHENRLASDC